MNSIEFMRRMLDRGIPLDMAMMAAEEFDKAVSEMVPVGCGVVSAGAERTRRWREKKASQDVTERHETSPNVTASQSPPPLPLSPQTPLSPAPPPESVTTRARKGAENSAAFDAFWERFPLKKSKLAAAKAYPKALRKIDHETLVRHLDHQISCGVWDGPYGPHASTWLNGERWADVVQPRRFAGMAGQPAPGYRGRQDTSLAEIAARRQREREQGMAVPGGETPVSGRDHGWADGAIDGEPIRRSGEG